MKWLGPLSRLFQFLATLFVGNKIARDRQKLKGLKAKVKALEAKDEVDEMSDDDITTALSEWVPKQPK